MLQENLVLPYACGEEFSLADILIYPWLERWLVLQERVGSTVDKKYTKVHQWVKIVQERDSIKKTRQSNEFYLNGYAGYF